jgi:hypothetical protein
MSNVYLLEWLSFLRELLVRNDMPCAFGRALIQVPKTR